MPWTRSSDVPIPTVWREFVGKTNKKYWIQDIPEDYKDVVGTYMAYGFCRDEPICKHTYVTTYADYLKEANKYWRNCLDQNVGLICFTIDEDGEWRIAGVNCTVVATPDNKQEEVKGKYLQKIRGTIDYVMKQANPFETLKIDEYLSAKGLYVLPEYRGEGIGLEILKARVPLCKALGIKTSITLFTSVYSQVVAEKAGFKDLYEISYAELEKRNPFFKYPGIEEHTKSIKVMYIKYE